ncbi:hypothetical protein GCM10010353_47660 [Streptomyces chryseus]|nr:hypothetical protein GCM10010353_47660 [Streptomyces chryseus]
MSSPTEPVPEQPGEAPIYQAPSVEPPPNPDNEPRRGDGDGDGGGDGG